MSNDDSSKMEKQVGDYLLNEELGSGGFAKVVLGIHIPTGEKVAIKIMDKQQILSDDLNKERVLSEIAILKIVRHNNIIKLYEVMETPQKIYLVMEYCDGGELFDYIVSKQHLSEKQACVFFQEIIDALTYLHSQNIVHRDVKPENILLESFGKTMTCKLIDFGISRTYTLDKLISTPCGTASYAPPEMHRGEEYYGLLSDVWSAGVLLYAMAFGYLPFCEEDEDTNIDNIIKGNYEIPEEASPELADFLKHILDIDPLTRYDLDQIKKHPWYNMVTPVKSLPGIIIGYHKIPIDDRILNVCEAYGFDKEAVKESVSENKYDNKSSIYYIILSKMKREGYDSIADLFSEDYLEYIKNPDNLIKKDEKSEDNKNEEDKNEEDKNEEDKNEEDKKELTTLNDVITKENEENKDKNKDSDNFSAGGKLSKSSSNNNSPKKEKEEDINNNNENKENENKENKVTEDNKPSEPLETISQKIAEEPNDKKEEETKNEIKIDTEKPEVKVEKLEINESQPEINNEQPVITTEQKEEIPKVEENKDEIKTEEKQKENEINEEEKEKKEEVQENKPTVEEIIKEENKNEEPTKTEPETVPSIPTTTQTEKEKEIENTPVTEEKKNNEPQVTLNDKINPGNEIKPEVEVKQEIENKPSEIENKPSEIENKTPEIENKQEIENKPPEVEIKQEIENKPPEIENNQVIENNPKIENKPPETKIESEKEKSKEQKKKKDEAKKEEKKDKKPVVVQVSQRPRDLLGYSLIPKHSFLINPNIRNMLSFNPDEDGNKDKLNSSFTMKLSDDLKENVLKMRNPKMKNPNKNKEINKALQEIKQKKGAPSAKAKQTESAKAKKNKAVKITNEPLFKENKKKEHTIIHNRNASAVNVDKLKNEDNNERYKRKKETSLNKIRTKNINNAGAVDLKNNMKRIKKEKDNKDKDKDKQRDKSKDKQRDKSKDKEKIIKKENEKNKSPAKKRNISMEKINSNEKYNKKNNTHIKNNIPKPITSRKMENSSSMVVLTTTSNDKPHHTRKMFL